jgi:hypothetical protein
MNEQPHKHLILLDVSQPLIAFSGIKYIDQIFQVPPNATKVGCTFDYHNDRYAPMFISLHDPQGFRAHRMFPKGRGDVRLELWMGINSASEGAIPGPLPAGQWRAQVDIRALKEDSYYHLVVYAEFETVEEYSPVIYPEGHVVRPEAGWYKGELHAHSTESDGRYPVAEVIRAAEDAGLDFFSLTDHTTCSQWHRLAPLVKTSKLAIIRSLEITSHVGHANLQGIKSWVNTYIDRPNWSSNQAADETHAQGGLFCINHAFSGDLAWRDFHFDWKRADLIEIYHNLEACNNVFQWCLWDQYLNQGYRLVGIGGIDSHILFESTEKLGAVVTWVYADELSESGIIEGIRRGKTYVSKGPQIRFTATNAAGEVAEMWEQLAIDGKPITFTLEINADEELRLFVIKNGMIMETFTIPAQGEGWQKVTFVDTPDQPSFYRLELHRIYRNEIHKGIFWRDFETCQVLTNPIWVK